MVFILFLLLDDLQSTIGTMRSINGSSRLGLPRNARLHIHSAHTLF